MQGCQNGRPLLIWWLVRSKGKRSRHPKSDAAIAVVNGVPKALGCAQHARAVYPGAAPEDANIAISGTPRRAIYGRTGIIDVPAILCPFPHIAMRPENAPWIGVE